MNTLATRLIWARAQRGMSQAKLAKSAGMAPSAIGNLEIGLRNSSRKITVIASILGVNALWLAEGKGSPSINTAENSSLDNAFYKIKKVKLKLATGNEGFTADQELKDDVLLHFRRDWMTAKGFIPEDLLAILVHGKSMEPGLREGDTVVVNTGDCTPADGEVFVINYEGEAVVRRLIRDAGNWWLSSDNPDQGRFPRKECSGDRCLIIGRVVYKMSEWV